MALSLDQLSNSVPLVDVDIYSYLETDGEWVSLFSAWTTFAQGLCLLSDSDLAKACATHEAVAHFATALVHQASDGCFEGHTSGTLSSLQLEMLRELFNLVCKLLLLPDPPKPVLDSLFLAEFAALYGKQKSDKISFVIDCMSPAASETVVDSLAPLKRTLVLQMSEPTTDPAVLDTSLVRLNNLLAVSRACCAYMMAGSDFLDGLVAAYKPVNPPLRDALITTTYLCLVGLTKDPAQPSVLSDQLYALADAAAKHKDGPESADSSLVAELVSSQIIMNKLREHCRGCGPDALSLLNSRLDALEKFRKPGGSTSEARKRNRLLVQGSSAKSRSATPVYTALPPDLESELSESSDPLIEQVKAFFPQLGSRFIVSLLHEYNRDVQTITEHLLDDSLPDHLKDADREQELPAPVRPSTYSRPAPKDSRDELDNLTVPLSRLHFGKPQDASADELLKQELPSSIRASIKAAADAYDIYDDERDDTYDNADVGGPIDPAAGDDADRETKPSSIAAPPSTDEILYRAWKEDSTVFSRDLSARCGQKRGRLRFTTGLTDTQIEDWGAIFIRDPSLRARFEVLHSLEPNRNTLLSTGAAAWRAGDNDDDGEDEDEDEDEGGQDSRPDRPSTAQRGRRGGGRGGGRGGRDGATPESHRYKQANRGSKANHSRRTQRAKKMSRGGMLPG